MCIIAHLSLVNVVQHLPKQMKSIFVNFTLVPSGINGIDPII